MKKIGLFLVMAVFSLKVSAQIKTAPNDTLKFAADKKEITTFLNLMHIAGLDTIYNGHPVTIFAPDNKAFEKLPVGMIDSLSKPANKIRLVTLLNNHILLVKLTAETIASLIRSQYPQQQHSFNAISGDTLTAKINANRNIVLSSENGGAAVVSQFDIQHMNAEFFIIDSVLLPKKYSFYHPD